MRRAKVDANQAAIVRLSGGATVRVWKNVEWTKVEYKLGDGA